MSLPHRHSSVAPLGRSSEIISRDELIRLAQDLLGRHPDLMQGFHQFLQRCETMDSFEADLKAIAGGYIVNLP